MKGYRHVLDLAMHCLALELGLQVFGYFGLATTL